MNHEWSMHVWSDERMSVNEDGGADAIKMTCLSKVTLREDVEVSDIYQANTDRTKPS